MKQRSKFEPRHQMPLSRKKKTHNENYPSKALAPSPGAVTITQTHIPPYQPASPNFETMTSDSCTRRTLAYIPPRST